MLVLLIVLFGVGAGVSASRFFPTEDLLQDRFALGQNYYAANDHENAVQIFLEIESTPNYALLEVDKIEVSIGELTLPLRVAATYQLGNSYRNVGRTKLERARSAADEGDSLVAAVRRREAAEAFGASVGHYRRLVDNESAPQQVRVMSQYQIVRADFQMENYPGVVAESKVLLERFPGNDYEEAALYDRGWAQYYMEDYAAAIAAFGRMLELGVDPLKIDRAIFQTGESYFALGAHGQARQWYGKLVDKYDFSAMSEKEIKAMKTAQIRGLVKETTRELVAKAQIRIGDALAAEERIGEALEAYALVPERYPQESLLVQKSYDNMANMVLERQGVDAGISVLRRAVEQVGDPLFRGRAQLRIARELFSARRYVEALGEYGVYMKAYGDRAAAIGFTLDRVLFMMGEAQRELGRRAALEGHEDEARLHYSRAAERYAALLDEYPRSVRAPEAEYSLGHALYGLGRADSALVHFAAVVKRYPRAPVRPYALSWAGRMELSAGDLEAALHSYRKLIADYSRSDLVDQTWKDMALVYKKMGRIDEAIDAFAQVDSASPLWIKIQAEIGDMLLAAGRLDQVEARLDLAKAIELAAGAGDEESLAELHYIQGRLARERDDPKGEIAHFGAALEHSANDQLRTVVLFFRGLAHYQGGTAADAAGDSLAGAAHFEAAVADLDRVLAAGVGAQMKPIAYRTRGVALTRLGRAAAAVQTYRTLIASALSAEERAGFELMLMELYYDQGQLEQTEKAARSLIAADFSDDNSGGFYRRERAYLVLASILLEEERYRECRQTAQKALGLYPNSSERATLELVSARSLFFLEEYDKAAAAFAAFIAAHPRHPDLASVYYQQGVAYEVLGEYEKAAAAFATLEKRFPGDALAGDALYRAGENLYNGSRFEAALAVYLEVEKRFGGTSLGQQALYSAAWTYMDLERGAESMATFGRLVAEYPASTYARYAQFSIGDYYYNKKEYEKARAAYEKVIAHYEGTPEAEKAQGLLADLEEDMASRDYEVVFTHFEKGDYEAAVHGFELLYEKYPQSYSALAGLANKGVALEHLGDSDAARAIYQRVLKLAAGSAEKREIVKFVKLRLEHL